MIGGDLSACDPSPDPAARYEIVQTLAQSSTNHRLKEILSFTLQLEVGSQMKVMKYTHKQIKNKLLWLSLF